VYRWSLTVDAVPKLIRTRSSRVLVLLLAVIALFAAACSSDSDSKPERTVTKTGTAPSGASGSTTPTTSAPPSSTAPVTPAATKVSIKTINTDGATYGVGMPVIIYLSKKPGNARAWQERTKVTADGKPLAADWYFEYSSAKAGYPVEAHLRPKDYWPAHSNIAVTFPPAGTSLGTGLVSDGKLSSLEFKIGASHITTVDNSTHTVTVVSDGKKYGTFKTSLGASNTPTKRGVKVIMEKGLDISMRGPGYYDAHVKYTQRLTYGGEYLHAAPWNTRNISNGVNSSNGCTNLTVDNAKQLYGYLDVGDVVTYPNANGPKMTLGEGYGDWNVSWGEWQTGGLVSTT
jgi:lipoprotein-anchoring transpeptidase ErfK/SrfK